MATGITDRDTLVRLWFDEGFGFRQLQGLRQWVATALAAKSLADNRVEFLKHKFGLNDTQLNALLFDKSSWLVTQINTHLRSLC